MELGKCYKSGLFFFFSGGGEGSPLVSELTRT